MSDKSSYNSPVNLKCFLRHAFIIDHGPGVKSSPQYVNLIHIFSKVIWSQESLQVVSQLDHGTFFWCKGLKRCYIIKIPRKNKITR